MGRVVFVVVDVQLGVAGVADVGVLDLAVDVVEDDVVEETGGGVGHVAGKGVGVDCTGILQVVYHLCEDHLQL